MTAEQQPLDGTVAHPPVMPGIVIQPRSSWPTVLGIIAIVFGAAATLQGGLGLLTPLFLDQIRGIASSGMAGAAGDPFAGLDQHRTKLLVSALLAILAGGWIVIGGILLVMRKPVARGIILSWAGLKMMVVIYGSWVGYLVNQAQFAAMQQSGGPAGMGGMGGMLSAMSGVGAALGLLWGWALPVFMLVWFMRRKIRNEIAAWA